MRFFQHATIRPGLVIVSSSLINFRVFSLQTAPFFHPFLSRRTSTRRTSAVTRDRPLSMSSSGAEDPSSLELLPSETAIVCIEYQNEFTTPGGKLHDAVKDVMDATNMLSNSAKLADHARRAGCTIIHCPISFESGHKEINKDPYGILAGVKNGGAFVSGEWGADICEAMRPQAGDLIVKGKSGLCGFASTNLDFLLRQNHIRNVVLCGFLTNCCVESSMRTAYELGYRVYTLQDCVAATSMEAQEATLKHNFGMFSIVTDSNEVMKAIQVADVAMAAT